MRVVIFNAFDKIATNPFDNSLDIKKLKNKKNHYRLRIGKYRILFEIIKNEILIYFYNADSRGDVYK
jgi:mRNA interferase RelE/StbE